MHISSMHCRRLATAMWRWPQASVGTVQAASNAASHRAPLRCFSQESGGSDDSSLASRIWRRLVCCRHDSYYSLPEFSGYSWTWLDCSVAGQGVEAAQNDPAAGALVPSTPEQRNREARFMAQQQSILLPASSSAACFLLQL